MKYRHALHLPSLIRDESRQVGTSTRVYHVARETGKNLERTTMQLDESTRRGTSTQNRVDLLRTGVLLHALGATMFVTSSYEVMYLSTCKGTEDFICSCSPRLNPTCERFYIRIFSDTAPPNAVCPYTDMTEPVFRRVTAIGPQRTAAPFMKHDDLSQRGTR